MQIVHLMTVWILDNSSEKWDNRKFVLVFF